MLLQPSAEGNTLHTVHAYEAGLAQGFFLLNGSVSCHCCLLEDNICYLLFHLKFNISLIRSILSFTGSVTNEPDES